MVPVKENCAEAGGSCMGDEWKEERSELGGRGPRSKWQYRCRRWRCLREQADVLQKRYDGVAASVSGRSRGR
eukprot:10243336-Heterocapsa_arctica.AAC.1